MSGSFVASSGSKLALTIGGTVPGSNQGKFAFTNSIVATGALEVTDATGYTPPQGTPYQVLTFGSGSSGTFTITAPSTPAYQPTYTDTGTGAGLSLTATHA